MREIGSGHGATMAARETVPYAARGVLGPGLVLGAGLGGFVDGIVLHQVLQWHHMLSDTADHPVSTVAGLEANTLADGLFHAVAWVAVVVGVAWLWRRTGGAGLRPTSALVGALLAGWGGFNVVEGVVDHHVLGIHHVRDDVANALPWDVAFLALGATLLVGGLLVHRRAAGRDHDSLNAQR